MGGGGRGGGMGEGEGGLWVGGGGGVSPILTFTDNWGGVWKGQYHANVING